jgi:cell division protein FtsW
MKKNPDYALILVGAALILLGVLMVYSASPVAVKIYQPREAMQGKWNHFLNRQLMALLAGLVLSSLLFLKKDSLFWLGRFSGWGVLLALVLLTIVLKMPGDTLGAKRFIPLGKFQFQPAEFAKIALVFFLAHFLASKSDWVATKNGRKFFKVMALPIMALGATVLLIEKEPALGSNIIIILTFIFILFMAGLRKRHMTNIFLVLAGFVALFIALKPYRLKRVRDWWSGLRYGESHYHIMQGKLGIGAGQLIGVGLGHGMQKYYIPEVHTDFIFAVIGEEFGLLGTYAVIGLFLSILYLGFKIAVNCKNTYLALLASGFAFMLGFQAYFNIGVAMGIFPCTGVTLPFISYGGTSLIVSIFALAVLIKISLYDVRENLKEEDFPLMRGGEEKGW